MAALPHRSTDVPLNVLIIDDSEINLTLFRALVGRIDGAVPLTFLSSAEALAWCRQGSPDVVVVDYMMPAPDGLDFIRQLRRLPGCADQPVLMVTANEQKDVRYQALDEGATDFLTKPVDKREFIARVRNMCALRQGQRAMADQAAWLADEVAKATAALVAREKETILCLSQAAEYRDPETGAHILRMAHYSRLIARNLGLSEAEQDLILEAAPMHDVGKVGTPDFILLKPGRLTEEEFAVMRQHAQKGCDILARSTSPILQKAAEIALTHHEKFDGSGYPNGLAGEAIPLHGRIVAVADVFDALTSSRPYKPAWSLDRARDYLRESAGGHFDPRCVEAFLADWEAVLDIHGRFQDEHRD
ncbi:putative two-component system response regulator [Oryzomicrobium terrae]|uniref:Putative two-component system response regulator n=1 Tax=Oryzomicrobium terrae TaxID=1735038 RepID=A0A5C1E7D2_9RHOO|nr:HD domain-containing phosphohydrolase [Oryzomicrobium terrae]QEL64830.1 putative two-component system response regulator [Oryzomicrobium terrae]